jgi:hypothetical protein
LRITADSGGDSSSDIIPYSARDYWYCYYYIIIESQIWGYWEPSESILWRFSEPERRGSVSSCLLPSLRAVRIDFWERVNGLGHIGVKTVCYRLLKLWEALSRRLNARYNITNIGWNRVRQKIIPNHHTTVGYDVVCRLGPTVLYTYTQSWYSCRQSGRRDTITIELEPRWVQFESRSRLSPWAVSESNPHGESMTVGDLSWNIWNG